MINFVFSNAFKLDAEEEHREVFKSLGIDKEGGFVFSIDTMQVFFFRYYWNKTHIFSLLFQKTMSTFLFQALEITKQHLEFPQLQVCDALNTDNVLMH